MSRAPYMPLFCDAYLGDTMHLSLEEHGAYLKLLMITWRNNGQPLPDDDARIARMLGVTLARWTKKLRPVLVSFFDISEGVWRQKRLQKTWEQSQKFIASQRHKGKLGGEAKSMKNNNTDLAAATPGLQPEPSLSIQSSKEEREAGSKTEPSSEKTEPSKTAQAPKLYGFVGKVIRLIPSDFADLQKTYHTILDLAAYASSLDAYYDENLKGEERKRWFIRFCAALDKRHQANLAEEAKAKAWAARPITERYPNDGVYGSKPTDNPYPPWEPGGTRAAQ